MVKDAPAQGSLAFNYRPPVRRRYDDRTLRVVDFSIFPHLGYNLMPENTMAEVERWAVRIAGPAYAIDDQTAIKVADGTVEVISKGHWNLIGPSRGHQATAVAKRLVTPG
jgi:hypothetical protein